MGAIDHDGMELRAARGPAESFRARLYRPLSVLLGATLLAAAAMKVEGRSPGAIGQNAALLSEPGRLLAAEVELFLGLWLLSGWRRKEAWACALIFFAALAAVSVHLWTLGQSTCGCFGRVRVHPWVTFAFDAAAVLALAVCRPARAAAERRAGRRAVAVAAIVFVPPALAAALMLTPGGAAADLLHRLRGESLSVEPDVFDLGEGISGERRTFELTLRNHTDRPVRVVGGTSTCSCVTTRDLPAEVPPGASRSIRIGVVLAGTPGAFQQYFVLYTDDDRQRLLAARFAGQVRARPAAEGGKPASVRVGNE